MVVLDFINKRGLRTPGIVNHRGLDDINVRIRRALIILDFFLPVVELQEQGLGAGMVQGDGPPIDAREEHAMLIILHFQVLCTASVRLTSFTSSCAILLLEKPTLTLGPTESDPVTDRVPPLPLHYVLELPLEVLLELQVPRVRVQTVEHIFLGSCGFVLGLRWLAGRWLGLLIFHFLLILDGNNGHPGAFPPGGGADLRGVGGLASELLLIIAYHGLI